jgi:class 3 adenylate cyclase/tetratricopeptide (TPR) repeat protein/ABC-type cobalamin transport system ATPase subunit
VADAPTRDRELRQATLLFTDVSGYTAYNERLHPEDAMDLFDPALSFLAEICEKYGGTVDSTAGDAIFVIFGVPKAIENSARAAVNAAIEMHNRIGEWSREHGIEPPLEIHTGINSGEVASGHYVKGKGVVGDPVNVASRLKDKSPRGRIWVGPETWRATDRDFEFRDLGPVEVKNHADVRVREVVSRALRLHRPAVALDTPLVGRERERAQLEQCVRELRAGRGGVATVVGDAGLGKSRLLAELGASEPARGAIWLTGRSLQIGSNLSFHPFADLLRDWADIAEQESGGAVLVRLEKAVAELFDGGGADELPFLATLLGVEADDAGRTRLAGITGDAMERLVLHATSQLLRRLSARAPLVLAFEDLHWADVSSLELLGRLLRLAAEHPILFVLALRPDPPGAREALAKTFAELPGLRRTELELRPLDRSAAEEMIDRIFDGGDLPGAARRLIEERTAGNPFYVGEVVRALLEQGALERRGDALFATAKIDAISIPPTVQEVIAARADRLPESARRVLQAAAILGRNATRRILQEIAEGGDLEADLAKLDATQLLVPRERAGETIFQFAHPLIQQAIYAGIAKRRRRAVHERIARAIEATAAPSGAGFHAELAYHWTQAGDAERAEAQLSLACDAGGATSEALQFLEEAARLLVAIREGRGDSRTEVLIHRKLAIAYLNRGKMVEGHEHLDRALALLGQRRPGTPRGRALRFGRAAAAVLVDLYLRGDRGRRPAATERDREVIDLMVAGAQAQVTADPTGFLFDSMEGLHRLNRVDPASVPGAGGIYAGAVGFIAYTGLSFGVGDRLLRRAGRFVNADDPRELFGYRVFGFVHRFLAGDWDDRHAIEAELVDENLRLGELWHVINYLPLDAKRRAHQGRFAKAAELLERIVKIGDLYAYDLARSNELAVRMFLEAEQGRLREALATAEAYFEGFEEELFKLLALGTKAKLELLLGERAAAEATLGRAREIARRTRFVPPFHEGAVRLAELRLALARLEDARGSGAGRAPGGLRRDARRDAERALACARKAAWQRPEALALAGSCAWLSGRRREALRRWGESVDAAERLGMRPELARTWREIARRLDDAGPGASFRGLDAAACRARSAEISRELGRAAA